MKAIIGMIILMVGMTIPMSRTHAADDLCSLGRQALSLSDAQLEEFYGGNIKARRLEGKGTVMNIWRRGVDKGYAVSVDCGNDVVVNVRTSADVSKVKTGQEVSFEGDSISYGKRRYIYSKKTYILFDLEKGTVR